MAWTTRTVAAIGAIALVTVLAAATAYGDDSAAPRAVETRLTFEPNQGQFDARVRFASRAPGYTLFLTDTEAVMVMSGAKESSAGPPAAEPSVVRLAIENARLRQGFGGQAPVGLDRQPGIVNYLIGANPSMWRTGIATYARVAQNDVLPGVDLVYYGKAGAHEYDLVVAPGVDPSSIGIRVTGSTALTLDEGGHLQLATTSGTLTMRAPYVYQTTGTSRRHVEARYTVDEAGRIGFAVGEYDTTAPLVIDPELVYSTFLGGSGQGFDTATGVSVDETGAAYIVGSTETTDFPTQAPLKGQLSGPADAFITKLSPDGTRIYSTYIGGSGYESGDAIGVRADGAAYLLGSTTSTDLPLIGGSQTQNGGSGDAFLIAVDPTGTSIVRSTYLGGSGGETPRGLQLGRLSDTPTPSPDMFGDVLIAYGSTMSTNFPTLQPGQANRIGDRDGFVTVFDRLTFLPLYSSYAGIPGANYPEGLQLSRRTGAMYMLLRRADDLVPQIARFTPRAAAVSQGWNVTVIPLDVGPQQDEQRPPDEESPWALDNRWASISELECARFRLGRGSPQPILYGILCALFGDDDVAGDVLDSVVMATTVAGCLPVPPATQCSERARLMLHDHDGHMVAHINFGGQRVGRDFTPTKSVLAEDGRIHMIGTTSDTTLPVVNPVQATHRGSSEGFVLTFDPATRVTSFFSYLGGSSFDTPTDIALDASGNRWIVGTTQSSNFSVTPNATQPVLNGRIDGFVVKISADPPGPAAPTNLTAQTSGFSVALSWNPSAGATSYQLEAGSAPGATNVATLNVGNLTALQGQAPAGAYFVRVRANTALGLSAPSNEAQFVLGCTAPPPPAATFSKNGSVLTVNWTAAAGATIYGLLVGTTPGGSNVLAAPVGNVLALQADISGVPAGTWLVDVAVVRQSLRDADDLLRRLEDAIIRAASPAPGTS